MKHFLLPLLAFITIFGMSVEAQVNREAPIVTIIHTNDTHSQIEPALYKKGWSRLRGGAVERAAILEYYRQQDPDLLYLDAGDMVQGSPYFNIFNGEVEMLCMNQQKLVASTFGNHEFDNGLQFIADMLQKADFPLVCANYHCQNTVIDHFVVPHLIVASHDVKIGITGVTVDPNDLIFTRNWAGITFEDPATAVNREAALLREEGCDLVIVLSHLGFEFNPKPGRTKAFDSELVPASHGVDLVIGGHSHVNIENGIYMNDADGHPVLITQTGGRDAPMGFLKIAMKQGSRFSNCRYSVDSIYCAKLNPESLPKESLLPGTTAPDSLTLISFGKEMQEILAPYQELMNEKMNVRLASAPESLNRTKVSGQCTLGNFTSDALRIVGEKLSGRPIEVSVMNKGGLRSDLPSGEITLGNLFSIYPFENTVALIDLRGSDLKELIESNAGRGLDCWSGIQIDLELLEKEGRLTATNILVNGKAIDPEKVYHLCCIDYLAEGNGGMTALTRAINYTNSGILLRDAMIDYVKELDAAGKPVTALLDDRIRSYTRR